MHGGGRAGGAGSVYVVKLGGSVVSDKSRPFSIRYSVLHSIASQLAEAVDNGVVLRGIVVGGGSFGHYTAAICQEEGCSARDAYPLISAAMYELALAVSDILTAHGLRVVIHPPHSFCEPVGLRPNCSWGPVRRTVEAGVVPLVYGDVYPCRSSSSGWCIVSGDELSLEMACRLGASYVVYVSDVDGVIVSGRVVERISLSNLPRQVEEMGGGASGGVVDVTGGIARKLSAVAENWCSGLRGVWLVNGLQPGRVYQLLVRGAARGTLISP